MQTFYNFNSNGEAGNPSILKKLTSSGLSAHAYRTYLIRERVTGWEGIKVSG